MALFGGGKEKKANAENVIMQLLAENKYLDNLVRTVLIEAGKASYGEDKDGVPLYSDKNPWLTKCQSYYDSRYRTVLVEPDTFEIKWTTSHIEQYQTANGSVGTQEVEDVIQNIAYAYTNDGYVPLHGVNVDGVVVDQDKVLYLWAQVIKERLVAEFPELDFSAISRGNGYAFFRYQVPVLEWKDWF